MKQILYMMFLLFSSFTFGQKITVLGTVTNSKTGEPIPGASIAISKTHNGTQTDIDGKYSLKVSLKDTLVFSYIGMKTQKIKADKEVINVQLEDDEIVIEGGIPYIPARKRAKEFSTITIKELISKTTPKRYFKANAANNTYTIYVTSVTTLKDNELEFQRKYNITYLPFDPKYRCFFRKHNKLTFKHLNKKYNKSWHKEIREDALGLVNFLD